MNRDSIHSNVEPLRHFPNCLAVSEFKLEPEDKKKTKKIEKDKKDNDEQQRKLAEQLLIFA